VDPFAAVLIVGFVVFALAIVLLGVYYPGSGLEQLGLRSARQIIETREELDALDLDQMLGAHNARRVAKGKGELTADDIEHRVMEDVAEQSRRRERYLADAELDQLLEATNARRRKRGLAERTRAEVQEEFGPRSDRPAPGSSAPSEES
jgi:hypothetical protein